MYRYSFVCTLCASYGTSVCASYASSAVVAGSACLRKLDLWFCDRWDLFSCFYLSTRTLASGNGFATMAALGAAGGARIVPAVLAPLVAPAIPHKFSRCIIAGADPTRDYVSTAGKLVRALPGLPWVDALPNSCTTQVVNSATSRVAV